MDLVELQLGQIDNRHPWELARRRVVIDRLKALTHKYFKEKAGKIKVLDVGSGDGYLVSEIASKFPNGQFYGLDINYSQDHVQQVTELYGKSNLSYADELKPEFFDKVPVDFVLFLDVIEHIKDEIGVLRAYTEADVVNQQTLFVITVPAFQSLFTNHDVFLGHFRRYNNKLLKERLSQAGLEVLSSHYFFTTLLVPRLFKRLLEKGTPKNTEIEEQGVGQWSSGRILTSLIAGVLFLDYKLCRLISKIGIRIPGLSLYCICRSVA